MLSPPGRLRSEKKERGRPTLRAAGPAVFDASVLYSISLVRSHPGKCSMADFDATTEPHPTPVASTQSASAAGTFVPARRVVAADGSELATETRWLLQQRLRNASVVLIVGFSLVFFRLSFLYGRESLAVFFYGILIALLVICTAALSSRWQPSLRRLRQLEIALFVLIVMLFMAAQYVLMLRAVRENDPARLARAVKISILWMVSFMFTYAIFIPNSWRRAARVIVAMALAPIIVPWILGFIHPELYKVAIRAASLENLSEDGVFLVLGAFTAIFGTHTINTLRTEAYRARLLNQYRLGRKLGGGGMGEVYLAEHQLLKRPCAIKVIRHDLIGNQRIFARFEREVRATAQLSHWNTIEIFDYGRNDNGAFFYVMEYLPGLSLADLVERFGPLPAPRVIYLLRQACDALHEAHEAGLVHRDIKPANLMAAYRGGLHDVTKILDFGLVKTLSEDEKAPHLSRDGTVAGSPLYMAPEQILHTHAPDRRTDVYALGAVAYFMLTGKPPFTGEGPMEVMISHVRDAVIPPSQLQSEIPADLESVVLRCLAKRPEDRYQDTPSLGDALDACADAANWSARHASLWWQTHQSETRQDSQSHPVEKHVTPTPPTMAVADGFDRTTANRLI
jgi:serine/threonine-protein kinase